MTNTEIKLITDPNIHLIVEKGITWGRCEPIYYHAKANNKYFNPNFKKNKDEGSYIVSLHPNSLYSTAKWRTKIWSWYYKVYYWLNPCGNCSYIFVVDTHYPSKSRDRVDEFPILSDKSIPPKEKTKKLMSTFYDQENCIISLCMLKYCLKKRLKFKKIHYMVSAEPSGFMKSYITFNNEKRTEYLINKDKFGVDRCKLMNNANFGKQIENVRKYKDTRIANNEEKAKKIASKVTLNNWHVLSESVTLHGMKKSNVLLDKPIIIGFMILQIAKLETSIYYDRLKETFNDRMELLYTDTDSLKLFIKNTNPYELKKNMD